MIRDIQVNVRMSPEERARLDDLAKFYGISPASVLRMLATERHRDLLLVRQIG
jgi:predicted DNA-binding protein